MTSITQEQLAVMIANAIPAPAKNPDAHLEVNDFDQYTKRRYFVTLEGSLHDLQRGTVSATWHAEPNCEHIYQRIAGLNPSTGQNIFEGNLDRGIIMGMRLNTISSTYPVHIGAIVSGIQGRTFLKNGKNYAFVAEAGKAYEPKECIFEPASKITRAVLQQYNDTNVANLENHLCRNPAGFTLVDNLCPLAEMLRLNSSALGMTFSISAQDPGWLKVDTKIVDACLDRYEQEQQVHWQDMNTFNIKFERVDGDWDKPEGVIDNILRRPGATDHQVGQRLHNNYKLTAQVEMDLVLYGGSATAQ
jgi:hypothetical protein